MGGKKKLKPVTALCETNIWKLHLLHPENKTSFLSVKKTTLFLQALFCTLGWGRWVRTRSQQVVERVIEGEESGQPGPTTPPPQQRRLQTAGLD